MNKNEFRNMIISGEYISWLEEIINKYDVVDDTYFHKYNKLSDKDLEMLNYLEYFFFELNSYAVKKDINKRNESSYYLKYKERYYYIIKYSGLYSGDCYKCEVHSEWVFSKFKNKTKIIDYNELVRECNIKVQAANIEFAKIDDLIEKIIKVPREFYSKIDELLSSQERDFIINKLSNKNCFNCTNGSCKVDTNNKTKTDDTNCIGWRNPELVGKSKILRIYDINKM